MIKMKKLLLTTEDNPFNPFTQYDEWVRFDEEKGYYTNNYLARLAYISNSLTEEEKSEEINRVVKEAFQYNLTGNYKIVSDS